MTYNVLSGTLSLYTLLLLNLVICMGMFAVHWEDWQRLPAGNWCWRVDAVRRCSWLWNDDAAYCICCRSNDVYAVGAELSNCGDGQCIRTTRHQVFFNTCWHLHCCLKGLFFCFDVIFSVTDIFFTLLVVCSVYSLQHWKHKLLFSCSTSGHSALGASRLCAVHIYYWHWHWHKVGS